MKLIRPGDQLVNCSGGVRYWLDSSDSVAVVVAGSIAMALLLPR